MADLIIKPATGDGNKLILQDKAGGAVLTTADSGATIASATLTSPTINTPAITGNATAANLTLSGDFVPSTALSHRNIIINGGMQVAQRGTSASSQTTSDYFTCDRWKTEASGATYNTSQQAMSATDLLTTGFSHFFRMEVTTGNNNSGISQKIEAKNIRQYRGENLTVSFYAKGTNPNGGSFSLNRFFTGQTAGNTSFTVTSSWVRYTITFVYPDEGSLDTTLNTSLMALSFLQPAGDTSTNAWTLDITGIQLELGSSATPFEHRSYGEELARCHRYYQVLQASTTWGNGFGRIRSYTDRILNMINLHTEMRVLPHTITWPVIGQGSGEVTFLNGEGYPTTHGSVTSVWATPTQVGISVDGFSSVGAACLTTWAYTNGIAYF